MSVIVFTVSVISLVLVVYANSLVKAMQTDLTADFIANLQTFNRGVVNISQLDNADSGKPEAEKMSVETKNYIVNSFKDELNSILTKNFYVRYIMIYDENLNKKYSTLNDNITPVFTKAKDPSSFKLKITNEEINKNSVIQDELMLKDENKGNFKYSNASNEIKSVYIKKLNYNIYFGIMPSPLVERYLQEIVVFAKAFFAVILFITLLVSFMLARSISRPLEVMEETVSKIGEGDLSGRLEFTKYYEVNKLVQSYNAMANALQKLYSSLEVQVQDRTRELKKAYAELQNTQAMMVHSEKMKSLGELVAGIMHEINNPINFIYGNMTHLSNYSKDLIDVIESYTKYENELSEEEKKEIQGLKEEIDYEFLKSDMPELIKSCKEGADRAKNIIQDLKSFSRMEEASITDVDIEHEIETTLNILHNKLKNKATIHKEYEQPVPSIEAFGGQLNQVFMNILDNAAGAIKTQGDIWIRIKNDESFKNVIIEIEDNGVGMEAETVNKVFDPFFTTKPVGQGTGLGLSITHKIIKNHQGKITVTSEKDKGTKFTIILPVNIDREALQNNPENEGEA